MVLLAKCLLLLFMIIVVHGHIVVDVEQKVNIDGCCNGCCPCNSCGCWNPMTRSMDKNGAIVDFGGCTCEICIDGYWAPDPQVIKGRCVKCRAFGEPHFRAFTKARFDWHIPCNHSLTQEGFSYDPNFGVFMEFKNTIPWSFPWSVVGPTTYKENPTTIVKLDPSGLTSVEVEVYGAGVRVTTLPPAGPPELLLDGLGSKTTVWAWKKRRCIMIYGKTKILIKLCPWKIVIWAPKWKQTVWPGWSGGPGGYYPLLNGLCSTNNPAKLMKKKLVARSGAVYGSPGIPFLCNAAFGFNWQTHLSDQPKPWCPAANGYYGPFPLGRRKKRDASDPQMVCSNFTESPHDEECHAIVQNSTLTGPDDIDMFHKACMFDLCAASGYINNTLISFSEMVDGYRQMTMEAKNEEDNTIDCCQDTTCTDLGMRCFLEWPIPRPSCYPTLCSGEDCTCCPI